MTEWTWEARGLLAKYEREIRLGAKKTGFDASDLVTDLDGHIRQDAEERAGDGPVTKEILGEILEMVGSPKELLRGAEEYADDEYTEVIRRMRQEYAQVQRLKWRKRRFGWGVTFPLIAILFEIVVAPMGFFYLDPMPTLTHLALLFLVPAGIYYLIRQLDGAPPLMSVWEKALLCGALGLVLAQSLLYSLVYLPAIPISTVSILAFGAGLLGFAPLVCLVLGIYYAVRLSRVRESLGMTRSLTWCCVLAGAIAIGVFHTGYILSQHRDATLLARAASGSPEESAEAIAELRARKREKHVMFACYHYTVMASKHFAQYFPLYPELPEPADTWRIFYQMTGKTFKPGKMPGKSLFQSRPAIFNDLSIVRFRERAFELPSRGVALEASAMDASISGWDGGSGVAYIEWVITFHNREISPREARTRIALPPGGVVSRLTLWVDGEEQEAAFGGRHQTMQAYRDVAVIRRQDPALVTTAGPDCVLLQCFPVPPGDSMKVKIGITAPLILRDASSALRLPYFVDPEFDVPKNIEHTLWLDSNNPIEYRHKTLVADHSSQGVYTLSGKLAHDALAAPETGTVHVPPRNLTPGFMASGLLGDYEGTLRLAAIGNPTRPKTVWLAVDGSVSMREAGIDWAEVLKAFPEDCTVHAVVYGDTLTTFEGLAPRELADKLKRYPFAGGQDAVPALEMLLDRNGGDLDTAIYWIHGPQLIDLSAPTIIQRRLKRGVAIRANGAPGLLSLTALPGLNRTANALDGLPGFVECAVLDSIQATLEFLARTGAMADFTPEYELRPAEDSETSGGKYDHVVRLAAAAEVTRLILEDRPGNADAAKKIAARLRLVTPVTGAVVLERKEQYQAHDLDPGRDSDTIPVIPEPGEWALIITATIMIFLFLVWRRKEARENGFAAPYAQG
jgi:hypothetical protein